MYFQANNEFYKTASLIACLTAPAGSVKQAIIGIAIDCTPPAIKYPVLCASLLTSGAVCVVTGSNNLAISYFVNTGRLIVKY